MTVRVLIVEDEEIAALAHAEYVGRVDGFEVAGVTRSAGEAMRHLRRDPRVDLVLLDMHLPDGHGLGLLQSMRSAGILCDVIAVTSARDLDGRFRLSGTSACSRHHSSADGHRHRFRGLPGREHPAGAAQDLAEAGREANSPQGRSHARRGPRLGAGRPSPPFRRAHRVPELLPPGGVSWAGRPEAD